MPLVAYTLNMIFKPSPDLTAAQTLLEQAGLPTADLTNDLLTRFIGAYTDTTLEGLVGYEAHGRIGLLRSLVVSPAVRSQGVGNRLIEQIEQLARQNAIEQLYLLTTDASQYFLRYGYSPVERDDVPELIQSTTQFSSLCPASATVMLKSL